MLKKLIKIFLITLALTAGTLLIGCNNTNEDRIEELTRQLEELKRENIQIKEELENLKNEKEVIVEADKVGKVNKSDKDDKVIYEQDETLNETETNMNIRKIGLDETVLIEDFAEFTIKKVEFSKRVNPPNPDSYYSYYQVNEDELIYLHVITEVKNLQAQSVLADEFLNIEAKYNDKYIYNGFSTIEKSGGRDFTYTSITGIDPLKVGRIHFLIEVPLEVKNKINPLELKININGKSFIYKVR